MENLSFAELGIKGWITSPLFNKKKWFFFIVLSILIGIVIALILAAIIYGVRKKKDKNITYGKALASIIMPSLFTGVAIIFLWIVNIRFVGNFPIELLVLSAILVSGFFSTVKTKNAGLVFIGITIVVVYLFLYVYAPIAYFKIKELIHGRHKSP